MSFLVPQFHGGRRRFDGILESHEGCVSCIFSLGEAPGRLHMDETVEKTIGPYPIRGRIGSGGMSTVYLGVDPKSGRQVAVKLMASFLLQDTKFTARFKREVDLLTTFDHPNIVPVLDYGEHEDSPYIVMPYMRQGTLQDRLQKGPLSMVEAARIIGAIARGLTYAHEHGVIHRDVKPSNILLDDDGNIMLSDFGFASWQEASLTLTGSGMVGTPAFMSPEQCRGDEVDARTDQYALGVVLYRLATGRLPYDGDSPLAIALKQINEPLIDPRKVNPHVPLVIEEVILRAMAKNPRERYPDMRTFNIAFQEAMLRASQNGQDRTAVMDSISNARIRWDRFVRSLRRTFSWSNLRRWPVVATLLLLFAFPLGGYAIYNLSNGAPTPDPAAATQAALSLQATIASLSTAAAAQAGGDLNEAQVQTVVAATMAALVQTPSPTPLPTQAPGEPTWTPTPSPTITDTPNPYRSPTPSPTGSGGGTQPSATPSRTPTPENSSTPTSEPTATIPPPPTNTPLPPTNTLIPPGLCNNDKKVSATCTPSP
jgi:serine/threonine protein kinase